MSRKQCKENIIRNNFFKIINARDKIFKIRLYRKLCIYNSHLVCISQLSITNLISQIFLENTIFIQST